MAGEPPALWVRNGGEAVTLLPEPCRMVWGVRLISPAPHPRGNEMVDLTTMVWGGNKEAQNKGKTGKSRKT